MGAGHGSCAQVTPSACHLTRSPRPGCCAPLPRPRPGQVWKLFARQGGLLSIASQEPNWSHSPSLLGPSWSSVGPTAVEVCAGPGTSDAEHKANRKKITKSQSKYYNTYCSHNIKRKFNASIRHGTCCRNKVEKQLQITPGHRRHLQKVPPPG